MIELQTRSPEQTRELGRSIGEMVRAGDLILLSGDLGTGKTCLTQGIAQGIGFAGQAASPSFVLMKEYPGRVTVYHIDLYRLDNAAEISHLGLDDYLYGDGVCVIEWADKAVDLFPAEHLLIRISHATETGRHFQITAQGMRYTELMERIEQKWNSP